MLFVSGSTEHSLLQSGDAPSFAQKPFSPEVFARKVREVLDEGTPEAA